jgi:hypothetical protein
MPRMKKHALTTQEYIGASRVRFILRKNQRLFFASLHAPPLHPIFLSPMFLSI